MVLGIAITHLLFPGQNDHYVPKEMFNCILIDKQICISIECHWSVSLRVQLMMNQHDLVPNRRQAITWTNADPVYRRIYAALGGDELNRLTETWQSCGNFARI